MFHSLSTVYRSSARFCTVHDRGDVWQTAVSSDHPLPDFGTLSEGLLAGSLVATETGWRTVETLAPGDGVLTFDNGIRKLVDCVVAPVDHSGQCSGAAWGLTVPKDTLGNRAAMTLLPSQLVLMDCDYATRHYGDPFILVPAGLLEGYRGIERTCLAQGLQTHMLAFDDAEIVHANGSALLACHATRKGLTRNYPCVTWPEAEAFRASLFGVPQAAPLETFNTHAIASSVAKFS